MRSERGSELAWREARRIENVAPGHKRDFDLKHVTPFAELVEILAPGAGGRAISRLLQGKATRHAALNWKAGRRGTPRWALDMLAAEVTRRHERERQAIERANNEKERLGLSAGALNLAKWKARQ